jgi:hypothetical protein
MDGPPDGLHAHSQGGGGQLEPGAQATGWQAQAQVPSLTQPPPLPPEVQVQSHGGQLEPGAHAMGGQAQVQLPPEPSEPPPEQSHSNDGQPPSAGQYSGLAQAQLPPLGKRAWQKPSTEQSAPTGHRCFSADHAQPLSAAQDSGLVFVRHGSSSTQAPEGQLVPAGHGMPSATQ